VLTYNIKADRSEWQPVLAINVFDYEGELLRLGGRTKDWLFTPNHRWPVWYNTRKAGQEVNNLRRIVKGYRLNASHRIPQTAPYCWPTSGDVTPRDAALIGWIVTDGHMRVRHKRGREYPDAVIYQKKQKHFAAIRRLLGDDARREYVDARSATLHFSMSSALARRLHELCPTKDSLPELVSRLTRPAARAMWKAMFDAEGTDHPRAGRHFAQLGGPALVAFQMLSILLNRSANTRSRADQPGRSGCYISRGRRFVKVAGALDVQWYTGKVWCPTTKNGTWFAEHNGACIITGNSWMRKNGALQLFHYLPQKPAYYAGSTRLRNLVETAFTDNKIVPSELRPEWRGWQGDARRTCGCGSAGQPAPRAGGRVPDAPRPEPRPAEPHQPRPPGRRPK